MTKEQIYDDQISPLMTQIIAICKKNNIAYVSSFALDGSEDDPDNQLLCTTVLLDEESNPPESFLEIKDILMPPRTGALTMMTVRDGDGKVKEMHAFL